ncbi:MAG: hypothetical protein K1X53_02025 [Candidatus Sumerlaeaceae bacterium]|nr:hypothetical protein [Candidatus Sumerlaeaceae bacterium]
MPTRGRNFWLLLVSVWFYCWGELRFLPVLLVISLWDYVVGLIIAGPVRNGVVPKLEPGGPRTIRQKAALISSLVVNLGILAFFKYFYFIVDNWNAFAAAVGFAGAQLHPTFTVTLPLGISFYTFQTMSYTLDVYMGNTRATRRIVDYFCFVTMFQQLVAGPIVRYVDVAAELRERHVNIDRFGYGVSRFVVGLAKKLLIANTLALPADRIFAIPPDQLTTPVAWLAVVCYAFQIYFDFSGYSDMAIGMGHMFGFKFLENFNYPYIARSLTDFWRRWHISLSTWFRDYLYIPLGGNRLGPWRTGFNLVLVFFLCGLWHGAAWNFVLWGLFHGFFLILERAFGRKPHDRPIPLPNWLRHGYVLLVVLISWVLFRSTSLAQVRGFLLAMAGLGTGTGEVYNMGLFFDLQVGTVLVAAFLGSIPWIPWIGNRMENHLPQHQGPTPAYLLWNAAKVAGIALLMALTAVNLSAGSHNPFIYFRF